ncbi:hypothetical protein E1B28_010975 [Marasmius oreades]|uniref:Uncharacterized protein n=1 Tax=Marasmius oreades TaxID=181124 RepID=A0A9P7RT30_9AGAR|nr:uncharacterized protein E1B28_010975 [Marasmius oreades]KAG7089276.1 hypothetical protein E1B28_010975 [Marasmius oreades]
MPRKKSTTKSAKGSTETTSSETATETPSNTLNDTATSTAAKKKGEPEKAVQDSYEPTQFWNFVNHSLKDVCSSALRVGKTCIGQQQKLSEFFQVILAEELKMYRPPEPFKAPSLDSMAVTIGWQSKIDRAMAF